MEAHEMYEMARKFDKDSNEHLLEHGWTQERIDSNDQAMRDAVRATMAKAGLDPTDPLQCKAYATGMLQVMYHLPMIDSPDFRQYVFAAAQGLRLANGECTDDAQWSDVLNTFHNELRNWPK